MSQQSCMKTSSNKNISFPLSKIQEQFWIIGNIEPNNTAYNIPIVFSFAARLNTSILLDAIAVVMQRHCLIRSKIQVKNNKPVTVVDDSLRSTDVFKEVIIDHDFSNDLRESYINKEVNTPFNIKSDYLIRVRLFTFKNCQVLSIVFHHIIIDQAAKNLFIQELSQAYNDIHNSTDISLNEVEFDYNDFVVQEEILLAEKGDKLLTTWQQEYAPIPEALEFSESPVNTQFDNSNGEHFVFKIPKDLEEKIKTFAYNQQITTFIYLLSVYNICLSCFGGQKNVSVGVPLTNRRNNASKGIFGCFINIVPVVTSINYEKSFVDLIKDIRIKLLKLHRIQELPFIELNEKLKNTGTDKLFQVGFTEEFTENLNLTNAPSSFVPVNRLGAQLDQFLSIHTEQEELFACLEYRKTKFDETQIKRFADTFLYLCEHLLLSFDKPLKEIALITDKDVSFIEHINNTACSYESNVCIHRKFEQQVDKNPEGLALITDAAKLTYADVEAQVNKLANYLLSKGVAQQQIIAVCCERRVEMMVSILAILKVGCIYLPIQVDAPEERKKTIVEDAKPSFIITSEKGSAGLLNVSLQLLNVDNIKEELSNSSPARPNCDVTSDQLAYIIYTSGSTGKPKGTLIEHHSVLNRIGWMHKNYPIDETDVLIQKTPITFDVSVWELFWWFFNGSSLMLLKENGEKDPYSIIDAIEQHNVSKIHFVPSMFSSFISLLNNNLVRKLQSLKTIFFSGEQLSASVLSKFVRYYNDCEPPQLVNLYGPTEATVDVSYFNCSGDINADDKIYIGKPIDNTGLYVVNKFNKLQPVGVKGELLITGVNLSRGYLNREKLTGERFIDFELPNGKMTKAYKTGDICILHENAEIEYLSREDAQVKIRGIRVELGEIEAKLNEHAGVVNSAVVVNSEVEHKSIIAYAAVKENQEITEAQLLAYLRGYLPEYMIPSYIVLLKDLPLTTSGKINKKELPELKKLDKAVDSSELPLNDYQKAIHDIWKKVLNQNNISINDNFFDVGGNSLLAIQVTSELRDFFNVDVDVLTVMEYPNIKQLSEYLMKGNDLTDNQEKTDIRRFDRRRKVFRRRDR